MKGWLASITFLLGAAPWLAPRAADVVVYRCTGADGQVSLQDAPCPRGSDEQMRALPRPAAATPSSMPAPLPPPPAPAVAAPMRVTRAPQPLFECVRPDGSIYENETGIPQGHYEPLWGLGMIPNAPPDIRDVGRPGPRLPASIASTPGVWVEDRCIRLPEAEACQRRVRRLDDLRVRVTRAQQRERVPLELERDQLLQQVWQECGMS